MATGLSAATKMTNPIRGLVSKRRIRYTQDGFDLDLTYINDRIIAMGYPADHMEAFYRNKIEDVQRMLEKNHTGCYKIYNLCSERSYDHKRFPHYSVYPFKDHNPPDIELIKAFCKDVDEHLRANCKNVVAVHCKAGKGRTGTMICCYLLYSRQFPTADEALRYYAQRRTSDEKGVTIPSQRRYVEYFATLLKSNETYQPVQLYICEIRITGTVNIREGTINVSGEAPKTLPEFRRTEDAIPGGGLYPYSMLAKMDYCMPLAGDVKIEFVKSLVLRKEKRCHFWFNTFFVERMAKKDAEGNLLLKLSKSEIDDAHKDKHHKEYPSNFAVELVLRRVPNGKYSESVSLKKCHPAAPHTSPLIRSSLENNWAGRQQQQQQQPPLSAYQQHHHQQFQQVPQQEQYRPPIVGNDPYRAAMIKHQQQNNHNNHQQQQQTYQQPVHDVDENNHQQQQQQHHHLEYSGTSSSESSTEEEGWDSGTAIRQHQHHNHHHHHLHNNLHQQPGDPATTAATADAPNGAAGSGLNRTQTSSSCTSSPLSSPIKKSASAVESAVSSAAAKLNSKLRRMSTNTIFSFSTHNSNTTTTSNTNCKSNNKPSTSNGVSVSSNKCDIFNRGAAGSSFNPAVGSPTKPVVRSVSNDPTTSSSAGGSQGGPEVPPRRDSLPIIGSLLSSFSSSSVSSSNSSSLSSSTFGTGSFSNSHAPAGSTAPPPHKASKKLQSLFPVSSCYNGSLSTREDDDDDDDDHGDGDKPIVANRNVSVAAAATGTRTGGVGDDGGESGYLVRKQVGDESRSDSGRSSTEIVPQNGQLF